MRAGMPCELGPDQPVLVRFAQIAHQHDRPPEMTTKPTQEAEHLRSPNVGLGVEGQGEGDPTSLRGDDQGTDPGDLLVGTGPDARVGVTPRRPHVRRSTGAIWKPLSSRQTSEAPR